MLRRGVQPIFAALSVLVVCACSAASNSLESGTSASAAPSSMVSMDGCTPEQTANTYPTLDNRTLKIAASPLAPPYIFTDANDRRRIIGFDADFVEAWTSCLGVGYEWDIYPEVSAMIAAVQSGRADLVHSELYVNPTRSQQVDFVVYMKSLTGSAVQKGNPKDIESLGDLCGKTDAQAVGVLEIPLVEAQSEKCKREGKAPVRLDVYRSNDVAVQALVTGRADAFLGDKVYVESIATEYADKVQTSFTIDNNLQIGVGVNKEQPELRRAILDAIKTIQKNGTQERLLRAWRLDIQQIVPAHENR